MVLEDEVVTAGTMDSCPYSAGEFCRSLRLRLWGEHMGLPTSDERLIDPLSPKVISSIDELQRDWWMKSIFNTGGLVSKNRVCRGAAVGRM